MSLQNEKLKRISMIESLYPLRKNISMSQNFKYTFTASASLQLRDQT
jgi:hypothetical protein